jgi:hypothetical protein
LLSTMQGNGNMPLTFPQARSRTQSPGRAYNWTKTLLICPNTQIEQLSVSAVTHRMYQTPRVPHFYQESRDGSIGQLTELRPTQLLSFLRWMMGLFSRSSSVWLDRAL